MSSKVMSTFARASDGEAVSVECARSTHTVNIHSSARSSYLKILTFVLACAAGVGFLYSKGNPQSADAADTNGALNPGNVTESTTDETAQATQVRETLALTNNLIDEFQAFSRKTHVPLTDLKLNPFRPAMEMGGFVEPPDDSTAHQRREQERQAVLAAVQSLSLKSVLHGKAGRACIINNALFQEGQEVDGFSIETISPDAVVVRKGAYRFELKAGK